MGDSQNEALSCKHKYALIRRYQPTYIYFLISFSTARLHAEETYEGLPTMEKKNNNVCRLLALEAASLVFYSPVQTSTLELPSSTFDERL